MKPELVAEIEEATKKAQEERRYAWIAGCFRGIAWLSAGLVCLYALVRFVKFAWGD